MYMNMSEGQLYRTTKTSHPLYFTTAANQEPWYLVDDVRHDSALGMVSVVESFSALHTNPQKPHTHTHTDAHRHTYSLTHTLLLYTFSI